jgi:RNA polymerase-binding transcription factor DksA
VKSQTRKTVSSGRKPAKAVRTAGVSSHRKPRKSEASAKGVRKPAAKTAARGNRADKAAPASVGRRPAKPVVVKSSAVSSRKKPGTLLIVSSSKKKPRGSRGLTKAERDAVRRGLVAMRDRISGNMNALREDSLMRHDSSNSEEDGTDAFDRQLALGLINNEHEQVLSIDDALQRLDDGTYGICESCAELIELPRLKALPFVRTCIACQSEKERVTGRVRPSIALGAD